VRGRIVSVMLVNLSIINFPIRFTDELNDCDFFIAAHENSIKIIDATQLSSERGIF
jgi:hypothetical protein